MSYGYGYKYGNSKKKNKIGFGVLKPCLIGLNYWSDKFSSDGLMLNDKSGNNNHAKLTQSNCLTFDGVDGYIALREKVTWFDTTTNAWTIEFWANNTKATTISGILSHLYLKGFSVTNSNANNDLYIRLQNVANTDELAVYYRNLFTTGLNLYRICYDGSKLKTGITIYKNNVLYTGTQTEVANTLTANSITSTAVTTFLGATHSSTTAATNRFGGQLFGIKAWKSVQLPGSNVVPDLLDIPMSCGGGDLTCDKSVNQNHGSLINFTLPAAWTKQNVLHENLLNGFSSSIKGDGTTGYYRISDGKFKNYGKNSFYLKYKFISKTPTATVNLFGFVPSLSTVPITGINILHTSGDNILYAYRYDTSAQSTPAVATVANNTTNEIVVAINRTLGKSFFFLNKTLVYSNAFSQNIVFDSVVDFFISARQFETDGYFTGFSPSIFLSYETGLAEVDETTDLTRLVPYAKLQPAPNSSKLIDVINGAEYTPTGTVYQIDIPTRNYEVNKDITGEIVMYPPVDNGHNGAETLIDFTNGGANTAIPSTYNAVPFKSALPNPFFKRNHVTEIRQDKLTFRAIGATTTVDTYALLLNNTAFQLSLYKYANASATNTYNFVLQQLANIVNAQGYYVAEVFGDEIKISSGTRTLSESASGIVISTEFTKILSNTLINTLILGEDRYLIYDNEITDNCLAKTNKYVKDINYE